MVKMKCPKCGSENVEFIDCEHQGLDLEDMSGYENGIYDCPKCRIRFGAWTDFNIEITKVEIDWIEDWEDETEEEDTGDE